jgi:two-component system, CitB family, response regulator MalR
MMNVINVLIVEDDPMVAEFNRRYLQKIDGFQLVGVASSVKEALNILAGTEVELILLDVFMPGKNGLELLAQIRKTGQGIDVIVISAACDMPSIKKALRYGAVDYLIKPFEFDRFLTALTSYREHVKFVQEQDVLSQAELDRRLFHKEKEPSSVLTELPKGLTKNTLKLVWGTIQEQVDEPFTTDDLANRAGISRVSLRKYVHFLSDIGLLESDIHYGSVGRPVFKHRLNRSESHLIKQYL